MQDERLKDGTEKLALQKEKEIKNQTEVIELKEEIEMSNKTITGLREELQANYVLIPELQNKIDVNTYSNYNNSLLKKDFLLYKTTCNNLYVSFRI